MSVFIVLAAVALMGLGAWRRAVWRQKHDVNPFSGTKNNV
jgi:hypothetical protein